MNLYMPLTLFDNYSNLIHKLNILNLVHFHISIFFSKFCVCIYNKNLNRILFSYSVNDSCSEFEFIQRIVEKISNFKLNCSPLFVARYPVGINYRVKTILSDIKSNDGHIIGIYGPGGIGKTTIAKVIFNRICDRFE